MGEVRPVEQKSLVLILARELADKLATAAFVVDEEGTLVYFNERAGEILGQPFSEAGPMAMDEWAKAYFPMGLDGRALDPDELPLVQALKTRQPAHSTLRVKGMDDTVREIAVTALPLFSRKDEFVGATAVFWEAAGPGIGGSG
jgi:PAS domain-containing protein